MFVLSVLFRLVIGVPLVLLRFLIKLEMQILPSTVPRLLDTAFYNTQ